MMVQFVQAVTGLPVEACGGLVFVAVLTSGVLLAVAVAVAISNAMISLERRRW